MARPSPLITRLRFLLVLLLLVGSLGLWWHHSQPKTFRLVKKFPLELCPTSQYGLHSDDGTAICRGIFYTNYGVYVRENAKKLVLYDWVGNKAWTIEVEESDYSAFARKVSSPRTKEGIPATSTGFITVFPWWAYNRLTCVAVSPSGRYVVTGVIKPGNVVVTTWSDGKRIGCCSLPLYVDNYERFPIIINVMDTGNTLVAVLRKKEWGTQQFTFFDNSPKGLVPKHYTEQGIIRQSDIYSIFNNDILASGRCGPVIALSPDNTRLLIEEHSITMPYGSPSCLYSLKTIGSKIIIITARLNVSLGDIIGYGDNPANPSSPLLGNGTEYDYTSMGVIGGSKQMTKLRYSDPFFAPPGARHLLQYGPNGELETLDLATMKSWGVESIGAYGGGVLSMDGKHILQIPGHRRNYNFVPALEKLCARFPALRERLIDHAPRSLNLYEAPGKLVARLPLQPASYSSGKPLTGSFWQDYSLDGIYPSPDGRTLFTAARRPNDTAYTCLVFRY